MTNGEVFDRLKAIYGSTDEVNAAIGERWKLSGYTGLRMAAAESLLDPYDAVTRSYEQAELL